MNIENVCNCNIALVQSFRSQLEENLFINFSNPTQPIFNNTTLIKSILYNHDAFMYNLGLKENDNYISKQERIIKNDQIRFLNEEKKKKWCYKIIRYISFVARDKKKKK